MKRSIGHLCHDEPREPPKKLRTDSVESSPVAKTPNDTSVNALLNPMDPGRQVAPMQLPQFSDDRGSSGLVQPTPVHTPHSSVLGPPNQAGKRLPFGCTHKDDSLTSEPAGMGFHHWMYSPNNQISQDMHLLHPNSFFNTSEISNEFSLLNDFLSNNLLEDGTFPDDQMNGASTQNLTGAIGTLNAAQNPFITQQQNNQMLPPSVAIGNDIVRPASGVPIDRTAREKYLLMAADPTGSESPEERLRKLLKAKYDAGLLKPFNYVKGYARMASYMERHINSNARTRILKQLEKFRPKFRELIHPLTDEQLVYVEVGFERKLMEYDRIFSSMAIPACCWRRSGEIYRGNKEMAELIHVPMEQLREVRDDSLSYLAVKLMMGQGKIAIHELFAESSLVMYWENFGSIAFDSSQKAILTTCALKNMKPGDLEKEIKCSFSFTIRRDQYNM